MNAYKAKVKRERREEANRLGRELVIEQWKKVCKNIDIGLLYILHFEKRHSAEWLKDFYKKWLYVSQEMLEQWQVDGDDTHYWVMEARLKADGIDYADFEAIQAEFEADFETEKTEDEQ